MYIVLAIQFKNVVCICYAFNITGDLKNFDYFDFI